MDMEHRTILKPLLTVAALLCLLMGGLCFAQNDKGNNTVAIETNDSTSTYQEAYDIGLDAYVYLYPLVTMEVSRRQTTNVEAGKVAGRGPMNTFTHLRNFPLASYKYAVRPNFDTLYSSAWLNLTKEPMIVSVPDTGGRYYFLQMFDMWADCFAAPGKRTTGTIAGNFALVWKSWNGILPEGVMRIDAPTPTVFVLGRTYVSGLSDLDAAHKVQDGYKITPLSQWGKEPIPVNATIDPTVDMTTPPLRQVNSMNASTYFTYAADLMRANPPHITDQPIIARMKRIGIEPGNSFDFNSLDPTVKQALQNAAKGGLAEMKEKSPTMGKLVNGWLINTDTVGVYGNYYLKRAIATMLGFVNTLPEDNIYPILQVDADGHPPDGNRTYLLHFNKSEIPPADAFWSVTMYDAEGFPVANSLNRYAIGDRSNLTYNKDGSLDIYIQNSTPSLDKMSNWLPAPREPMSIYMRLYSPRRKALDGTWSPPPVKRVS